MNCLDAKNLLTVGIFGRMTNEQKDSLERHLKSCHECAARFERSGPLMGIPRKEETELLPDQESSWVGISLRAFGRAPSPGWAAIKRWVPAAAGLLLVFTLGYFIGRQVLDPGRASPVPTVLESPGPSLAAYADHLRPVLINFLNRDGVSAPDRIHRLEKRIIQEMLSRTRLLKGLAEVDMDPALWELLQDLEFILTAMDNLKPGDRRTARHLAGLILDKHVPVRLHELITVRSTI